jgi:hypothetical protein
VNGIGVLRQQGEPDIISRKDGAAQGMLVDITDIEVFEDATGPALFYCHLLLRKSFSRE